MKKFILIACVFLSCCLFINLYSFEYKIKNSFSTSSDNHRIDRITVILNQPFLLDKEKAANEIIKRCKENSFQNFKFSYDRNRYPVELHCTVYLTEHDYRIERIAFEMEYRQDIENNHLYNIVEHPEEFTLEIK